MNAFVFLKIVNGDIVLACYDIAKFGNVILKGCVRVANVSWPFSKEFMHVWRTLDSKLDLNKHNTQYRMNNTQRHNKEHEFDVHVLCKGMYKPKFLSIDE